MTALPISLPSGFIALVKTGDAVTIGQVIARNNTSEEVINIPKDLSISISKVRRVLKKRPGDYIKPGDILAVKRSFFGLNQESLISKANGIVIRYERDSGVLVVKESDGSLTESLISPVDGVITLCDNGQIVVSTDKNISIGKKGIGGRGEGEVFILEQSFPGHPDESEKANVLSFLDGRAIGKIIVGGTITKEMIIKGASLGAFGIIGMSIPDEDIVYMTEKNITLPIIEIDLDTAKKLWEWKGKVLMEGQPKSIIFLQT